MTRTEEYANALNAYKNIDVHINKTLRLIGISAIEKQIPKKPDFEGDGCWNGEIVYDTWICPCCEKKYEVDYEEYDYCPHCGQAIDWSEEE